MTWPKPPNDNGVGIHFGDVTLKKLSIHLPLLHAMHAKWVVLACEDPVQLGIVAERLLAEGIMPIARPQVKLDSGADFAWAAEKSKSPYVQIYNEPGDDREWRTRPSNWWSIFRNKWIRQAHRVRSAGCKPGLQILSPDELWDMLEWMKLGGDDSLWPDMWLSLHLYPARGCPPSCTEHGEWDILGYARFVKACEEMMGFVPPIIVTEGGYNDGQGTPEERARWMVEIYEWFKHGLAPNYLFAFCPWILFGRLWYGFSWAQNMLHQPMLEAVKAMGEWTRKEPTPQPPPEEPKDWRVVSWWQNKQDALLLRHDCQDAFGGTWVLEERG